MTDSTQVITGLMAGLASILTRKLGRSVRVFRVDYATSGWKGHPKIVQRYTLTIEGCHPPAFYGMTTGEIKQRMAMLIDLLQSGVVHGNANGNASGIDRSNVVEGDQRSDEGGAWDPY